MFYYSQKFIRIAGLITIGCYTIQMDSAEIESSFHPHSYFYNKTDRPIHFHSLDPNFTQYIPPKKLFSLKWAKSGHKPHVNFEFPREYCLGKREEYIDTVELFPLKEKFPDGFVLMFEPSIDKTKTVTRTISKKEFDAMIEEQSKTTGKLLTETLKEITPLPQGVCNIAGGYVETPVDYYEELVEEHLRANEP